MREGGVQGERRGKEREREREREKTILQTTEKQTNRTHANHPICPLIITYPTAFLPSRLTYTTNSEHTDTLNSNSWQWASPLREDNAMILNQFVC